MTQETTRVPNESGCNPRQRTPRGGTWRSIRESTGLSIREMADRTGINRGQLSKIENGRACPTPLEAQTILNLRPG
jgi:DNA-binding transcriptional regulator YiaG